MFKTLLFPKKQTQEELCIKLDYPVIVLHLTGKKEILFVN
jgi:hypothetical protein